MTISTNWLKIIGSIVTALLSVWQIGEPWNEIIQTVLDALLSNLNATGLGAMAVGLAVSAYAERRSALPQWQREAISNGAGRFSEETGAFEWNQPPQPSETPRIHRPDPAA